MPKSRAAPAAPTPTPILIEFDHGLGDAVQLTAVLKHLKHYFPHWAIDVAALQGKHSAFTGLCRGTLIIDRDPIAHASYTHVYRLHWHECNCDKPDEPSTKTTRCLREVFQVEPIPELCTYTVTPNHQTERLARQWLDRHAPRTPRPEAQFKTVLIHYQGNTSSDKKDLPHELIKEVCNVIIDADYLPVILDWDGRSPLIDHQQIACPAAPDELWQGMGTGDAATLAALIQASSLMIGVDSGPLHVAGATATPTVAVWTGHHPVHFFDHADNVLHFVPAGHRKLAAGPACVKYFEKTYRHQTYRSLNSELPALIESILTGQPFEELANKRFLSTLRSTAYDRNYYEEHKTAGLDYLGHGDWQIQYGRWLIDALQFKGKTVLDVGCACGSILRGLGAAGAIVQGIDVNEHMIALGRKKWPDMSPLLHVCDAVNLHLFPDAAFDGLHSAQVAEHWQPKLVPHILTELHRVTKPGARFFCALDTKELFARQGRDMDTEDPTHICVKPLTWWHEQLASAGWQPCTDEFRPKLTAHPDSFLQQYDWDWFVAINAPEPLTIGNTTISVAPTSTSSAK